MDVTQLQEALSRRFKEERARLVFWNDPEGVLGDLPSRTLRS